jgi:hypothetical protein
MSGTLNYVYGPEVLEGALPSDFDDLVMDRLIASSGAELSLAPPSQLAPGDAGRAPLVGCVVLDLMEGGPSFPRAAVLVASCLESGVVQAVKLMNPEGESPDEDDHEPSEGFSALPFAVDLRGLLVLPERRPETHRLNVVLRATASSPVDLVVGGEESSYRDEEVEKFLAQRRTAPQAREVSPPAGEGDLPSYEQRETSPEVPTEPGLAMAAARVAVIGMGPLLLEGSFRLPLVERDRVAEPAEGAPTNVVPVSIVVTGSNIPGPWSWDLGVPCAEEGEEVTGHFALDLLSMQGFPQEPQTLFVYAVSRGVFSGPAVVGLVTPDMLG